MDKPEFNIVIPARYGSSRFPGKPLHPINGRPMLLHVVDRARESSAQTSVVATDDERIYELCQSNGVEVVMTAVQHPSGTDRIAEVADKLDWQDDTIIVGLQGDEPATPAEHLDLLAQNLHARSTADMATLCFAVSNGADYLNSDRVKVVRDKSDMALYFSRSSIPAVRDAANNDAGGNEIPQAYIHVGLYAYKRAFLKHYVEMAPSQIEVYEQLEQLRVLYHGGRIHVAEVQSVQAHGVDRLEDIAIVENLLSKSE